jgi:hypothetical protein
MLDPTSNMYLEKNGIPLNAYEIREEWFYRGGQDLVFVIGKERAQYKKSDLPIFLVRFKDFGDLTVEPDELDKYGFIGYVPNTNFMDAGEDYGQMFITKDALCAGTKWHERINPPNPAVDPYFPLGQAALSLHMEGGALQVQIRTLTPNLEHFEIKIDNESWKASEPKFVWTLHEGQNQIGARTLNRFGVHGPVARAVVKVGN